MPEPNKARVVLALPPVPPPPGTVWMPTELPPAEVLVVKESPPPRLGAGGTSQPARLVPAKDQRVKGERTHVFFHEVTSSGPDGDGALNEGSELVVRLWSETPNDLLGARFIVTRELGKPTVSEAEYIAHLNREERERTRAWREEQRERSREASERQRYCNRHHDDEGCWGEGGRAAYLKRAERRYELYLKERAERETRVKDAPPRRHQRASESCVRAAPPARSEARPASPGLGAQWIPGRWEWAQEGCRWVWLGGFWQGGPRPEAPTIVVSPPVVAVPLP